MRRTLAFLTVALGGSAVACGAIDEPTRVFVEQMADNQGLPDHLLTALVWTESSFCPGAVSQSGAIGYGQLMPATARGMHVNPYDAQQNIWGAAHYLRQQWDTFHDWNLALAAYNAGPGAVMKFRGVPPFSETQRYVTKVLGTYAQLVATFGPKTTPNPLPVRRLAALAPPVPASVTSPQATVTKGASQATVKVPSRLLTASRPTSAITTAAGRSAAANTPQAASPGTTSTALPVSAFLIVRPTLTPAENPTPAQASMTVVMPASRAESATSTLVTAQLNAQADAP